MGTFAALLGTFRGHDDAGNCPLRRTQGWAPDRLHHIRHKSAKGGAGGGAGEVGVVGWLVGWLYGTAMAAGGSPLGSPPGGPMPRQRIGAAYPASPSQSISFRLLASQSFSVHLISSHRISVHLRRSHSVSSHLSPSQCISFRLTQLSPSQSSAFVLIASQSIGYRLIACSLPRSIAVHLSPSLQVPAAAHLGTALHSGALIAPHSHLYTMLAPATPHMGTASTQWHSHSTTLSR